MSTSVGKSEPLCQHLSSLSKENVSEDAHDARSKVHFSMLGALGLQFSITGAPITLGTYLSLTIGAGGSPGYFWGFVMVGFFQFIVGLAVAELASALPHSSGPAHWVVVLAPARYGRNLGYIVGWLLNCAWLCICSASCLYPAQLTLALVQVNHPDYTPAAWHIYLVYCAFAVLYLSANLPYVFKSLGQLLQLAVFLFNGTALFFLVTLLVRTHPKQAAEVVFIDFINGTGWSSDGWVFFIALLPGLAALGVFDSATHLTDELENPTKQVPIVLIGSLVLSYFIGIPMILVYQFCNIDPESMLQPVGGQPLVQLMLNATSSLSLTIAGISLIIICFYIAGAASLISWSRLYWSFSRGGALPFSTTMSKLTSRESLPLHALLWNTFLVLCLGAISIGSSTAMNALFGGAGLCSAATLISSFGLLLWRGRSCLDERRWFKLGQWGTPIFWIATSWVSFTSITICMPLYLPVTADTMNYTAVVFLGFTAVAGVYWLCVFSKSENI